MKLDKYDTIILDCDGVIFDSNLLKVKAFEKVLEGYDKDLVKDFLEYFKNNFGTSRYHLSKIFITEFLKIEFDEVLYNKIIDEFGNNCLKLYLGSAFTDSFLDFISKYSNKNFYVASGGNETELNVVFNDRGISNKFVKILGSPKKKVDLVKNIVDENRLDKIIMIGDAKSDFLAATDNKIDFIFMSDYSLVQATMKELSKKENFKIINNLGDLI